MTYRILIPRNSPQSLARSYAAGSIFQATSHRIVVGALTPCAQSLARMRVRVGAPLVGALRPLCLPLRSCAYPSCPAFLPPSRLQTIPGVTPTEPVGVPLVDALTPLRVLTPNLDCVPYARENTSNAPNPPSDRTRRGAPCGCPSAIVPTLALLGIPFMSSLSAPFSPADHTWRHPDRTRRGAPCGCPYAVARAHPQFGLRPLRQGKHIECAQSPVRPYA